MVGAAMLNRCLSCLPGTRVAPSMSVERWPIEVAYLTDVEGNLRYFEKWLATTARVVRYDKQGNLELAHANAYFVYGGDVVDKGPGDIRLCRLLTRLKKRYPDRVALLCGNRDLNKLRFSAELDASDLARPIEQIPAPHWDPKASTLKAHLEKVAEQRGLPGGAAQANTRPERLKYMLQHTLGCPDTFEHRRQEVALLRGDSVADVTDDQVADSFVAEAAPGGSGALREYLEVSSLAALLGNTLFVHGAVDAHSMGLVPADATRFEMPGAPGAYSLDELKFEERFVRYDDVARWVVALNAFLRRGLADHAARPTWDAARRTRGGEALLAAQNRCAVLGRSIVSNCFADGGTITSDAALSGRSEAEKKAATDPQAYERMCSDPRNSDLAAWLRRGGVRRLVVGHKPSGDSPAVLCSRFTGLEVVSADTSYSDVTADDDRGVAVAGLLLQGDSLHSTHSVVYGTLRDGRKHEARLRTLGGTADGSGGDPYVGSEAGGGWWVKALVAPSAGASEPSYLLCRGAGRKVEYQDVPRSKMAEGGGRTAK